MNFLMQFQSNNLKKKTAHFFKKNVSGGDASVVRRRIVRGPDALTRPLSQLLAQLRELTLERDHAVREFPQHLIEFGDALLVERRLDLKLDDPGLGGGERRVRCWLFARVCT